MRRVVRGRFAACSPVTRMPSWGWSTRTSEATPSTFTVETSPATRSVRCRRALEPAASVMWCSSALANPFRVALMVYSPVTGRPAREKRPAALESTTRVSPVRSLWTAMRAPLIGAWVASTTVPRIVAVSGVCAASEAPARLQKRTKVMLRRKQKPPVLGQRRF